MSSSISSGPGRPQMQRRLKKFSDFRKAMTPKLKRVPFSQRESVLRTIYPIAEMKQRFEDAKQRLIQEATESRDERAKYKRIITSLTRATREVANAFEAGSPVHQTVLENVGVLDTLDVYLEVIRYFSWERDEGFAREIHPQLRTKSERKLAAGIGAIAPKDFPGVGSTKIDHWFIRTVEKTLSGSLKAGVRRQVIKDTLEVAFGVYRTAGSIKMALVKTSHQSSHSTSSKKPR